LKKLEKTKTWTNLQNFEFEAEQLENENEQDMFPIQKSVTEIFDAKLRYALLVLR